MKKLNHLVLPSLLLAALCLPAFAQDEGAAEATATGTLSSDVDASAGEGIEPSAEVAEKAAAEKKTPKKAKKGSAKKQNAGPPPLPEPGEVDKADMAAAKKEEAAAKKAAAKEAAAKKKAKKKAEVSEYKFSAVENVPTYKFDRKANPIVKPGKKKAAKKGAAGRSAPAAKLQPAKHLGEENTQGEAKDGGQQ